MKKLLLAVALLLLAGPGVADVRPATAGPGVHVLTPPLHIAALARERTIRVYLPPSYGHGHRRYPVLYMHDAQNLFDDATSFIGEWGVDETMDMLARTQGIEVIVVGIDNGQDKRINELSPWPNPRFGAAEGEQYMDFVVGTVKPYIDRTYRTRRDRRHTGIMGSSIGALISHYALFKYPEVFSKAGIFSPSYWFSDQVFGYTAAHRLRPGTRVYLAAGDKEDAEMTGDVMKMDAQMRASEKSLALHTSIRRGAEHNETSWKREFPEAMIFLFGKH